MRTLEEGQNQIQKICDVLRKETLEPAQKQADTILQEAYAKAQQLVADAKKEAEQLIKAALDQIQKERNVFQSSLTQASKQGVEALRQQIEKKLFNDEIKREVGQVSREPKLIAQMLTAMVQAAQKEGVKGDLLALIPHDISPQSVVRELGSETLKGLKGQTVELGNFKGGAQLKLVGDRITLDMTDATLQELLLRYLGKEFRKMLFT